MIFTIPNIVFVILIGILTAYLTFLTTKGQLTNNRYSNLFRRLTKRGKLVFLVLLLMLSALIFQEINNQNLNENRDFQLQKERNERDKSIKRGIDSSNTNVYRNLSKAFAEQGLKIDSMNTSIIKLRDSVKKTVNNYNQPHPVFKIKGITTKKDSTNQDNIIFTFTSRNAPSSDVNITCHIAKAFNNKEMKLYEINGFPKDQIYPANDDWSFNWKTEMKDVFRLFLRAKGSYKNINKTTEFQIDEIILFEVDSKKHTFLFNQYRKDFINFLEEYPKNEILIID